MFFLGRNKGRNQVHASSPMLAAARESMAVNSGSDSAGAATPEWGSPAKSSSSEDIRSSIDVPNETLGTPWDGTAESLGSCREQLLREKLEVRGDWPVGKGSHCNPQIAQSTSRWSSACGREARASSERGSRSHPREERETRSQRWHGYTFRTNT